ncbi:MAG: SMP-30/gluconolactonase/LRE family protein [Bacteroidetes bacterium]|nr:SMP-30/gluconolactonase/LRE family protein [Bacteroidota bacterium]
MKKLLAVIGLLGVMKGMAQVVAFDSAGIVGGPLKTISQQFLFTEGAAVDKKGNVFFTDQPNNKIWEYTLDGQLVLFMDSAGRSNGMYFDRKGRLIACADQDDQIWAIDGKKRVTVLVKDFGGRRFNGPNDLWIDSKGGIFFSDPYYQRDYWVRTKPDLEGEKVYYLAPGASAAVVVAEDFKRPNGIVGTPDGRYLYVSDLNAGKTYKYTIGAGGALSERVLFCPQGSDGMTLDAQGNLYLTGNGVTVYSPEGRKIARIPVPEKWTGNLCFGGKDRKTLFITASTGFYSIPMKTKGVE